jgi:hypothetical protein
MPAKTAALRITLEHVGRGLSGIQFSQFSQFSGGATAERIARLGFGSGSVREILGCGFW